MRACQTSLPQLGVLDVCATFSVKSSTRVYTNSEDLILCKYKSFVFFFSTVTKTPRWMHSSNIDVRWREMFVDSALMICKEGKKLSLGTRTGWPEKKMFRVFLLYCLYNNPPCFQCTFRSPVQ